VTADFQHYNSGYEKAVRARNDRVPELIRYSTARLHAQDRAFVAQLKQRGLIFKGQSQVYVKKVTIVANRAQLRVCHHDSAGYYVYANTGKSPVTVKDRWISYEVRAVQRDGRWQLNQYDKRKFSCEGAH
jgi:G:T-mismatch repair DNA endonuclease (very short patch repair protein)